MPGTDELSVGIRTGQETDHAFVLSSWIKSYKQSPVVSREPHAVYFPFQKGIAERALKVGSLVVLCNPSDHDQVYSYAVVERRPASLILHWLYTKAFCRKLGFARLLLEHVAGELPKDVQLFASHIPPHGFFEHLKAKYPITYNPHMRE